MHRWACTTGQTGAVHWESSVRNELCQHAPEEVSALAR